MAAPPPRLALFGGTFDPVHDGHVALAGAARAAAALERVVFLPCRLSPHKQTGAPPTSGAHRLAMLRLALAGRPWAEVSDFEITRQPPSFSWETVEHFARREPGASWHWILGADQWAVIESWSRAGFLREQLHFLVFPREPLPPPQPRPGWRMSVVDCRHPAAATAIRAALAGPGPGHAAHLAPAVARYIAAAGLYRIPL
jgi:nicotinate-nucleotide adenylyltransferase